MFRGAISGTHVKQIVCATSSQCRQGIKRSFRATVACYMIRHAMPNTKFCPQITSPQYNQHRCFWGVDVAFNRVDEERVRLAGSDRAAAEWVLRNGGTIKWTTSSNRLDDYNMLPTTQFDSYKLEELDLSGTDVIGIGFEHLKDLQHVKKIRIHGCKTVGDDGLSHFVHVSNTLTAVEISGCPMITEKGLGQLAQLKKLQHLVVFDLMEIKNLDTAVANLRLKMPWLDIKTEAF